MARHNNVFEAIEQDGHDEHFLPSMSEQFIPTNAAPGSRDKINALRDRVKMGVPLWHCEDRYDYNGMTGAVPPRYL
jgi:hypothetical protein